MSKKVRTKRVNRVYAEAIPSPVTKSKKSKANVFKYLFISHESNHHKPFLLRGLTLSVIAIISVFFIGISALRFQFLHGTVLGQEIVSSVLIDMTNETRIKYGESPLIRNPKLELASKLKADDMAQHQYFAHNSPTGVTPWHWLKQAGYDFKYAGENLAIDFTQSQDVEEAWLKSPTHRANILNGKFQEIGITTKEGMINGHKTIYVVQMFGSPKSEAELAKKDNAISTNNTLIQTKNNTNNATETTKVGEVAGAEITNLDNSKIDNKNQVSSGTALQTANTIINSGEYVTLLDKDNMLVVADKEALAQSANTNAVFDWQENSQNSNTKIVHYSNFWQKLVYNFWFELNIFYRIIVLIITISIATLLITEFKKHHWFHLSYGIIIILLMLILLYFNQALW